MITVTKANPKRVYRASMLPDYIIGEEITWTRQGMDEEYNVTVNLETGKVIVEELIWNEDESDWECVEVSQESVNLTVVLP